MAGPPPDGRYGDVAFSGVAAVTDLAGTTAAMPLYGIRAADTAPGATWEYPWLRAGSASAGTVAGSSRKTARAAASDPLAGTGFATGSLIVAIPAPTLTTTPATQGPVTVGSSVTWTLTYGNTGGGRAPERRPRGHASGRLHVRLEHVVAVAPGADGHPRGVGARSCAGTSARSRRSTSTAGIGDDHGQGGRDNRRHRDASTSDVHEQRDARREGRRRAPRSAPPPASASVLVQALDITLGKSVDKTFIGDPAEHA